MYDYFLGGVHNFPADREAADKVIAMLPFIPAAARGNRAFLVRAVRYLATSGVRQFLDIGSGIPTVDNVHEIVQRIAPDSRVVYVDIDTVAVAESLELLDGNHNATAIRGDLRDPVAILDNPETLRLLDFEQPVAVLLAAVLHFVPDDAQAHDVVRQLVRPLATGSYLVVSHGAAEGMPIQNAQTQAIGDVYRRQTATPGTVRGRAEVEAFFTGLEMVDPGVVWMNDWRRDPDTSTDLPTGPQPGGAWVGVGRKPSSPARGD
jgi:SAM-dependent methyltransferase